MDQPSLDLELDQQIAFHKRWKTYCMLAYGITAIGTIVLTAATSILAAFGLSGYAAIGAAVATVLIGTEKTLLFREKWKLHLAIVTKLNALKRRLLHGKMDPVQAVEQMNQVLEDYSTALPIAKREE